MNELVYIFLLNNRIVATIKGDSEAKKYFLTHHTDWVQCYDNSELISEGEPDVFFNKPVIL